MQVKKHCAREENCYLKLLSNSKEKLSTSILTEIVVHERSQFIGFWCMVTFQLFLLLKSLSPIPGILSSILISNLSSKLQAASSPLSPNLNFTVHNSLLIKVLPLNQFSWCLLQSEEVLHIIHPSDRESSASWDFPFFSMSKLLP